jgi:hypothetical protein
MPSFIYNRAAKEILDGTIKLYSDSLKFMLVNSNYVANRDDDILDTGGANDPVDAEILATNYVRGYGGAGRKAAVVTFAEIDAADKAVAIFGDLSWTALGGITNDTIAAAILIKEGGVNDTTSRPIAYLAISPTVPTNGSDFNLDMDGVNGNLQLVTT